MIERRCHFIGGKPEHETHWHDHENWSGGKIPSGGDVDVYLWGDGSIELPTGETITVRTLNIPFIEKPKTRLGTWWFITRWKLTSWWNSKKGA